MKKLLLFLTVLLVARAASAADLLLVADEASLKPLIAKLDSPKTDTVAAWTFWTGKLSGKDVVLTRTEGDPLNAVAATTLAIRRYAPKLVVTFGTARPHDLSLVTGDIVVSEQFVAIDGMISNHLEVGSGSKPLTWHKLPHPAMTAGEKETYLEDFPVSQTALTLASGLANPHGRVLKGRLGSANQVNREADRVAFLRSEWKSSTEDTESAHVAFCAYLLSTQVIGFRSVNGTPEDAAAFTLNFVEAWK